MLRVEGMVLWGGLGVLGLFRVYYRGIWCIWRCFGGVLVVSMGRWSWDRVFWRYYWSSWAK